MLSYNGFKIIPAPLVTINKTYRKDKDSGNFGTSYNITLNGTLLSFMGSPSGHYSSLNSAFWNLGGYPPDEPVQGNNEDFNSILRKQEAIRHLFREDGKSLEWQPSNGQPVVKCNPRVQSINFEEGRGQWSQGCDYTIQLEADWIYINGTTDIEDVTAQDLIESLTETWAFEEVVGRQEFDPLPGTDGQTYRVSHNISARGILGYDENGVLLNNKPAWEHARDAVNLRVSGVVDSNIIYTILGASGWFGGEYVKNPSVDKKEGSFSVVETWLLKETLDAFIEKNFSVDYNGDTNEYSVRYTGIIRGFALNQHVGSKEAMDNAKTFIPSDASARLEASGSIGSLIGSGIVPEFPSTKNFVLNNQDSTINFSFEWSTASTESTTNEFEATTGFEVENGIYTLALTQQIVGHDPNIDTRLILTKSALLSDPAAFVKAIELVNGILASGVVSSVIRSKNTVINDRRGTVRGSWSWDSSSNNNGIEITIRTELPSDVFASIAIPGRSGGPVIQDMNTSTSETINVTVVGVNQTTKPDGRALADAEITNVDNYLVTQQEESFNPTRKRYDFRITYLEKT